jgi:hypothetical protein
MLPACTCSVYGASPRKSPPSNNNGSSSSSGSTTSVSSGSEPQQTSSQQEGGGGGTGGSGERQQATKGGGPIPDVSKPDVQQQPQDQGAQLVLGGVGEGGEGGPGSPRSLWVLWVSMGLTWTAVIAASLSLAYYVLSVKRRGVTGNGNGNGSSYGMYPWQLVSASNGQGGGWKPPSPKAGAGWQIGLRTNGSGATLGGNSGEVQAPGSHATRRSWG